MQSRGLWFWWNFVYLRIYMEEAQSQKMKALVTDSDFDEAWYTSI